MVFRIDGPKAHGAPGLADVFDSEPPGLMAPIAAAGRIQTGICSRAVNFPVSCQPF